MSKPKAAPNRVDAKDVLRPAAFFPVESHARWRLATRLESAWWHAASKQCECPQTQPAKVLELTCCLPTCRVQVSNYPQKMAGPSCPSASICAADPAACQSHLTDSEYALLATMVTVPLFSMLWMPLAGSFGNRQGLHELPDSTGGLGIALGFSSGMLVVMASLAFACIPTLFLLLAS